jgi:RNA polymerase sigma-70 factor (ECF subfamily)
MAKRKRFFASVNGAGEICYPFDSRGYSRSWPARSQTAGNGEVQAEDLYESIRTGLISMLPRLMRFADLLAGERRAGARLLGRALRRMLAEEHRYQRGTALDCWAFAEIYRLWLEERRDHAGPETSDARFGALFCMARGRAFDAVTATFLKSLPPPQRLTLLLVLAERFDFIDAGRVLDVSAETISQRLVRIAGTFADGLAARDEREPAPCEGPR